MTSPNVNHILIVGVGGLGTHMVHEALERELTVSVMVRDRGRLSTRLDADTIERLSRITVGDATDPAALDRAMQDVDVAISGNGAHRRMALAMAEAVKRNGVQKLIWPAGGSNAMEEDGVTPAYKKLMESWPGAEQAYRAHQACIDAIRGTEINYVIFGPGRMTPAGRRSPDVGSTVRINRVAGMSISYEDAAWVMLEAATTSGWDRELVSAATPH
ncbi:BVR-B_like_SDR_a multi-domain protein [Acidipropionibacterium acidipropionici ATCC 4875]|uniref:BVR-B_like_SDR_a multi-domain protein n=1 Tax=Acidipropionibacterium acidipropionici (strain ATCC 4875 / DSM 20272 / JCM 6432 / NBRC 12425 / NCIMB 8070 / 4) TaxID=1171373 RepID=K7RRB8_ACIA4|nr:NAD(P)-binding oxidoreductase [Acidipropionibacterium acidipropionici]AFV90599.1 BVR-B_like_SDR_a multi-domain protein [Acidipropionibacterium acidipropionici ATCC 4875]